MTIQEISVRDMQSLLEKILTAKRLSTLGSGERSVGNSVTLMARLWSRVRSSLGLVFTARQKRFNIEVVGAFDAITRLVCDLRYEIAQLEHRHNTLLTDVEPPHFRSGTFDQGIWLQVNRNNEYQLPESFDPTDVIIDIGAHIGSFAFACLRRGARRVDAYEPYPANAELARLNLARFGNRATVHQKAVWRSDKIVPGLSYEYASGAVNTGGGNVLGSVGPATIETVQLDALITEILASTGATKIRLLKVDCEGSEYPILLTSQKLHLVDAIYGEFHEGLPPITDQSRVSGVERFDRHILCRYLTEQGFQVELQQHDAEPTLGLFFARRV